MLKRSLPSQQKLAINALLKATAQMSGKNAASTFVKELLTEAEMVTVGRRLLMARMILSGKTQAEIRAELGVSPNTFTRVRKWLEREIPEYGEAVKDHNKRQREKIKKRQKSHKDRPRPFTLADLRRRYPAHFLLFNVSEELLRQK